MDDNCTVEKLLLQQIDEANPLFGYLKQMQSATSKTCADIQRLLAQLIHKLEFNPKKERIKRIKGSSTAPTGPVYAITESDKNNKTVVHKFDAATKRAIEEMQLLQSFLQLVTDGNTITFEPDSDVSAIDAKQIDDKSQTDYVDSIHEAFEVTSAFLTK
jgi:hypothetical protein